MGAHHSGKTQSLAQSLHVDYHENFLTLEGYEKMPIVSLEVAVEPLMSLLPSIQTYVRLSKQKCENPADGLTQDESASIMLCTMRWQPLDQCLSVLLNTTLCSTDRQKLKPWFLYLKLLLRALGRLPSAHRRVFRGIKLDVSELYTKDKTIVWNDFALCTNSIDILHSEKYLGRKGPRTIFTIECNSSKDISKHLFNPSKYMILLPAATQFKVIKCLKQSHNDLYWIHLKEVQSTLTQIQSASFLSEQSPDVASDYRMPFATPPFGTTQLSMEDNHRHNEKLEKMIAKYPENSNIQLRLE
ncbi:unnamed protein product [Rotaria magnacalcarata]|uniref:NAD(P)(+)--arginine ADP-ribosyltransferase n=3 Tax=Rotaria magnacalcarata TaxID=392030 RepID=A0A819K9B4_9BILA|nr:unnamed protein product [Rotaria magnacalcarata]CAF3940618.1 unnamed protein product [Rotaria magnacalcarata]